MKVSIIGGGNMGGAIACGLTTGSLIKAADITVSDINTGILKSLSGFNAQIGTTTSNADAVKDADIVIIAVKPWLIDRIVAEIQPSLQLKKQIIVSIVAGVPFEHLNTILKKGDDNPMVYRVIPNIAISVGESMTMISACNTTPAQDELVQSLFNELGKSIMIEERLMAAGTALGSCGTAFALRYVRASMEAGIEMGLYPHQAQAIVAQTVKGAVELLMANGTHPETEIDKVCTPGGITIKGLNELEHAGFTSAVIRGLKACK